MTRTRPNRGIPSRCSRNGEQAEGGRTVFPGMGKSTQSKYDIRRPRKKFSKRLIRVKELGILIMASTPVETPAYQWSGKAGELVRVAPMVGRHDERNRWWGCEISFDSGLDSLFGVDHNKQMASHLTSIVEGFADSDRLSYQIADEAGEDSPWMPLYQIVRDVRDNTASMRREVIRTLQQKRTPTTGGGEEDTTPDGRKCRRGNRRQPTCRSGG